MPLIHLTTFIEAPLKVVFDLSRSIDVHMQSMQHSNEVAVSGKTSGLIGLNETVTWQAYHLFKRRQLQVQITAMELYKSFTDEMIQGDFKMMKHEHHFKETANGTIMIDLFYFESPYGVIGRLVDKFFMHAYLKKQLLLRNNHIRRLAESQVQSLKHEMAH